MNISSIFNIFAWKLLANKFIVTLFTILWMVFSIVYGVFYYHIFKFGNMGLISNVVILEVCLLILLIGISLRKKGYLKTFNIFCLVIILIQKGYLKTFNIFCLVIILIQIINVITYLFVDIRQYNNANDITEIQSFRNTLKKSCINFDLDDKHDEYISHCIRIKAIVSFAFSSVSTIIMIIYYSNPQYYTKELIKSIENEISMEIIENGDWYKWIDK